MPQATPFLWDSLMYNPIKALPVLSGFVRYVIEDTANWSKSRPVSSSTRPEATKALKQIPGIDIMHLDQQSNFSM